MNRLLLFVALLASLSATAARPNVEEILAENNFQIVSDLYQERPIWVKTYHCDSATAIRTLMMNPQIIIEREFEGRLICRMCDVRLLRISDPIPPLPIFMTWAATFYFTVEVFDDEYRVELCEAVWNGVRELSDDVDTESYTLYGCFFTKRGNLDNTFIRNRAEALNDRLTRLSITQTPRIGNEFRGVLVFYFWNRIVCLRAKSVIGLGRQVRIGTKILNHAAGT